ESAGRGRLGSESWVAGLRRNQALEAGYLTAQGRRGRDEKKSWKSTPVLWQLAAVRRLADRQSVTPFAGQEGSALRTGKVALALQADAVGIAVSNGSLSPSGLPTTGQT